jgi:hypothetical protein
VYWCLPARRKAKPTKGCGAAPAAAVANDDDVLLSLDKLEHLSLSDYSLNRKQADSF